MTHESASASVGRPAHHGRTGHHSRTEDSSSAAGSGRGTIDVKDSEGDD